MLLRDQFLMKLYLDGHDTPHFTCSSFRCFEAGIWAFLGGKQ